MKNQIITLLRTTFVLGLLLALPLAATLDRHPRQPESQATAAARELPSADLATTWQQPARLRIQERPLPEPAPVATGAIAQQDAIPAWSR